MTILVAERISRNFGGIRAIAHFYEKLGKL